MVELIVGKKYKIKGTNLEGRLELDIGNHTDRILCVSIVQTFYESAINQMNEAGLLEQVETYYKLRVSETDAEAIINFYNEIIEKRETSLVTALRHLVEQLSVLGVKRPQ